MLSWQICQNEFEFDGALRDIYVLATTIDDWSKLYGVLRSRYCLNYFVDLESRPLPDGIDEAFSVREVATPMLQFVVADMTYNAHFFTTAQIELDISPREVDSPERFAALLEVIQFIGNGLQREVRLAHENDWERPFILYEPRSNAFTYTPIGSGA
jgi:hypothetical protein